MKRITFTGLARAFTNLSLGLLFGSFAYAHYRSFLNHHRASLILIVMAEALFAFFVLVRRPAAKASYSPWDWITTIGGTFAPLLLRPAEAPQDLVAGQIIQVIGACLAVSGVLSLNRSVGLVPAHREIKCTGLYRWVRHPLYCAYTVTNVGYLISNFTILNLALVMLALAFQIVRIFNEERFLSQFPAYAEYKLQTKWRMFPYLF